jgi:ABC transporter substrate binding protein
MRRREFITFVGGAAAWPLAVRAQEGEHVRRRVGLLMGLPANDPGGRSEAAALKRGLEELGWKETDNLEIQDRWPGGSSDLVQASAKELVEARCDVIVARSTPDIWLAANREQVVGLAARHQLPAIYGSRLDSTGAGLMSYGPVTPDLFRRAASYVDRILKGEKPAELPVQAPTKYELIINLKTARALSLTVPPSLLSRADELID